MDKMKLKSLLSEVMAMVDCDEEKFEDKKEGMPLSGEDAGDGGSDGVTDLGGMPKASPANTSAGNKKALDVIAAGMKRSLKRY
jgi:hypothetical protein